jgi:hypothetical protein
MTESFSIEYCNPHRPVSEPERYEGYDVVSAHYDYMAAGASATIAIGDYSLELSELVFVNWIRKSLALAEGIATGAPDFWPPLRETLPELPAGSRVHFWIAADIQWHAPILVFVVDGERVLVYTRSSANVSGPKLIRLERDREAPYVFARTDVVATIADCISRYLDDLAAAFPFLLDDEVYRSERQRLLALRKGQFSRPNP